MLLSDMLVYHSWRPGPSNGREQHDVVKVKPETYPSGKETLGLRVLVQVNYTASVWVVGKMCFAGQLHSREIRKGAFE